MPSDRPPERRSGPGEDRPGGDRGRSGGRDSRGGGRGTRRAREERPSAGPAEWGRIARGGAANLTERTDDRADRRRPNRRSDEVPESPSEDGSPRHDRGPVPGEDDLRRYAGRAVERGRTPARDRRPLPRAPRSTPDPAKALERALGPARGPAAAKRLEAAARSYDRERFDEARKALKPLAKQAPGVAEVRELHGLTLYRLGRWDEAIEELEAFRELAGTTEQHPVLADCHRAVGHWDDVDELWRELGEVSPAPELVTEGRIVAAGAKADRGDLDGAIRMLEQRWKAPKRPRPDHLRRAYALADLYDRAGRAARARELFRWVEDNDPDLADVRDRVRGLG